MNEEHVIETNRYEFENQVETTKETQQAETATRDYGARLQESVGSNRDTEGLGTVAAEPFTIGSVAAINGEDGEEAPEFVPTRHELKQLASYWVQERLDHDFDGFVYQCSGSSEWRWSAFIGRRLTRLANVLDAKEMRQVWSDATETFRKRCRITQEDWRVFTKGTEEEQEAWRSNHNLPR